MNKQKMHKAMLSSPANYLDTNGSYVALHQHKQQQQKAKQFVVCVSILLKSRDLAKLKHFFHQRAIFSYRTEILAAAI